MHSNLIRFWISWNEFEPTQGQFDPTYAGRVDQVVQRATACHINVMLTVIETPRWAAETQTNWSATRAQPGLFQGFVSRLLLRYRDLYALEVWNEVNHGGYWVATPAQYATLVNEAAAGRNQAKSHTNIIAGALIGRGGADYLNQLYAAGMHGQNGVSVHPYAWYDPVHPSQPYLDGIREVHNVMMANHDQSGIWVTEFGFAACPAQPTCQPENRQAAWLAKSFKVVRGLEYVRGLTAFTIRDIPGLGFSHDTPFWDRRMGMLTTDFRRRPAWYALRKSFENLYSPKPKHKAHKRKNPHKRNHKAHKRKNSHKQKYTAPGQLGDIRRIGSRLTVEAF
jgi:hypothetical protein